MTYPNPELARLIELVTAHIREPATYADVDSLTFDPALTVAEQGRLDRLKALIRSAVHLEADEWETMFPVIVSTRTHRTRTNAEWSAMTAAQRDSALIDWNRDLTDLLRALLRDQ